MTAELVIFTLFIMTTTDFILNIGTCAIVVVAMWFILTRFLKRLKQIEIERWGEGADYQDGDSFLSVIKLLMKKTPKKPETEQKQQ